MTDIPENSVTQADLVAWYNAKRALDTAKAQEMLLRMKVCRGLFPNPEEGTNTVNFNEATIVKMDNKIDRKVDSVVLDTLKQPLLERNIKVDALIRWKPELNVSEYRMLTEEERKFFDQVLEIKPGTPQLKIEAPKSNSK